MTGQMGKIGTNISEEPFKYAGLEIRFLLTSSDCDRTMSVFEFSVPPNFKIPGPAQSNDRTSRAGCRAPYAPTV